MKGFITRFYENLKIVCVSICSKEMLNVSATMIMLQTNNATYKEEMLKLADSKIETSLRKP